MGLVVGAIFFYCKCISIWVSRMHGVYCILAWRSLFYFFETKRIGMILVMSILVVELLVCDGEVIGNLNGIEIGYFHIHFDCGRTAKNKKGSHINKRMSWMKPNDRI